MRHYATGNSDAGSKLLLTSYNISPQSFQHFPFPYQAKHVVVFRLIPRRIEGRLLGDESRAYRQRWRVKWMRIYEVSLLKICCATFKSRICGSLISRVTLSIILLISTHSILKHVLLFIRGCEVVLPIPHDDCLRIDAIAE